MRTGCVRREPAVQRTSPDGWGFNESPRILFRNACEANSPQRHDLLGEVTEWVSRKDLTSGRPDQTIELEAVSKPRFGRARLGC